MLLRVRLYLLLAVMFAIIYAVIAMVAHAMGISGVLFYVLAAVALIFVQYMLGPVIIQYSMGVRYLSERDAPELHAMVADLAGSAGVPKPRVGLAEINIPNAFAFGRSQRDGRVCVTRGLLNLLSREELRAVLGHEMTHLKNRDVLTITMLSVVPMVLWFLAWSFMFSRRRGQDNTALIGIGAFFLYFVTNLLVLYGSRIREYYADRGSVALGNRPNSLASALYKLVYGSARLSKEELKKVEGCRAFFASDPSRAATEFTELKELDKDLSGTIDAGELEAVRSKKIRLRAMDRWMEVFSTHPNMLKRIKRLSELG
jgi:heat shock protein HtpX